MKNTTKYKAWATVCNDERIWAVAVYSGCDSIEDANRCLEEFCEEYENSCISVIGTTIEPLK